MFEKKVEAGSKIYLYGDYGIEMDIEFVIVALVQRGEHLMYEAESLDGNTIFTDLSRTNFELVNSFLK